MFGEGAFSTKEFSRLVWQVRPVQRVWKVTCKSGTIWSCNGKSKLGKEDCKDGS